MRALGTLGLCTESAERRFALTEMGQLLGTDAPGSLRAWTLWWGGHLWRVWSNLLYSVRTGKSARQMMLGTEGVGVIELDPQAAATFHRAMGQLTRLEAAAVVRAYDFSSVRKLVDVGGGR